MWEEGAEGSRESPTRRDRLMLIGWVAALCLISTHTVWKAKRKKHSRMVQRPALPVLKGAASSGSIGPETVLGWGGDGGHGHLSLDRDASP